MDFISPLLRALFSLARLPVVYRWTANAMAGIVGRRIPSLFWVVGRRISLSDAARLTYEEARSCRSIVADAAERLGPSKSPGAVLDYIATYIAKRSNIWGKRRPSTEIELIDPKQSKKGTFSDAASMLSLRDPNHTVFTDLQIDLADLEKILQGLKTETKI
ncbi:MAG TPA: hypothetical protein VNW98_04275 [Burkholderiaceae bacterium]|jgi:hypothetical protein|nr:hypothetical protein [Burkholderiaceae bacterium]